jgi:hypothetical protein
LVISTRLTAGPCTVISVSPVTLSAIAQSDE